MKKAAPSRSPRATYAHYLAVVAVYPEYRKFYAMIADDWYVGLPDIQELWPLWYEARGALTGNFFTHFDDDGLPVDQHNNIFWTWAGGVWHCTERHDKFHLKFDRIGEGEMLEALKSYSK